MDNLEEVNDGELKLNFRSLLDILILDDGASKYPEGTSTPLYESSTPSSDGATPPVPKFLEESSTTPKRPSPYEIERALHDLAVLFGSDARPTLSWRQRTHLVEALTNLDESWRYHPCFRTLAQRVSFAFFPGISELEVPKDLPMMSKSRSNESDAQPNKDSQLMNRKASKDKVKSGEEGASSGSTFRRVNSYSNIKQRLVGMLRPGKSKEDSGPGNGTTARRVAMRRRSSNDEVSEKDVDVEFDDPFSDEEPLACEPSSPTSGNLLLSRECSADRQAWLRAPLGMGERVQTVILRQRYGATRKTVYRLYMQHRIHPQESDVTKRDSVSSNFSADSAKLPGMPSPEETSGVAGVAEEQEFLLSWRKSKSRTKRSVYGVVWCIENERQWKQAFALAKVRIQSSGLYILEQISKNLLAASSQNPRSGEMLVARITETSDKLIHVSAVLPEAWARPPSNSWGTGEGAEGKPLSARKNALERRKSFSTDHMINELNSLITTGYAPEGYLALKSKVPVWSSWQGCHTLSFDGEGRVNEPSRKNIALVQVPHWEGEEESNSQRSDSRRRSVSTPTSGRSMYNAVVARLPNPSSLVSVSGRNSSTPAPQPEGVLDERRKLPAVLQLGKISEDRFSLDFAGPLSPLQAFVLAMSVFDA